MPKVNHLNLLRRGQVEAWNSFRKKELGLVPDLAGADLAGANLRDVDLSYANLSEANLTRATLTLANLTGANLARANLEGAPLRLARLGGANLAGANLSRTDLWGATLKGANLDHAHFYQASLINARLQGANLRGADFVRAQLYKADLTGADLTGANLFQAILVDTNLTDADLTGCRVFGISAWNLKLSRNTKQQNLVITDSNQPQVTADDIEVAQFLYLMLHNDKLRRVIDTITSKVVLILGRFTPERKATLDALRDELRKSDRNYVPVVFDFEKPRNQTTIETVTLLARMASFVIADLTDAKSVLQELQAIVPFSPKLAIQPIILSAQQEPGMFDFFAHYNTVLRTYFYDHPEQLIADLDVRVIRPAKAKALQLRGAPKAKTKRKT